MGRGGTCHPYRWDGGEVELTGGTSGCDTVNGGYGHAHGSIEDFGRVAGDAGDHRS